MRAGDTSTGALQNMAPQAGVRGGSSDGRYPQSESPPGQAQARKDGKTADDLVRELLAIFGEPLGQIKEVSHPQIQRESDANLRSAAVGLKAVRDFRMQATHGPELGQDNRNAQQQLESIRNAIENGEVQSKHGSVELLEKEQRLALVVADTFAIYENLSKNSEGRSLPANCWEQSMVALASMAQQDNNPRLELVFTKAEARPFAALEDAQSVDTSSPDHSYILVGRDPSTDPLNHKSWNRSTVILDAMANLSYGVDEFPDQMQNLSRFTGGSTALEVMTFHPETTSFPASMSSLAPMPTEHALTRASQRSPLRMLKLPSDPSGPKRN